MFHMFFFVFRCGHRYRAYLFYYCSYCFHAWLSPFSLCARPAWNSSLTQSSTRRWRPCTGRSPRSSTRVAGMRLFRGTQGGPTVVALSPYHVSGRDEKIHHAVMSATDSWSRDQVTAFQCKQCFHRGVNAFVVLFVELFGSDPQDRMSIV